jgi:hypothetical protein
MQEDATVGRVLLASLHQAIAEVLPARLDVYEHWLSSAPDESAIAVESFAAMLACLHQEGEASDLIVTSAGRHAAVRSFHQMPAMRRAWLRALPRRLRAGKVVRLAARMLPALHPDTRIDMTRRGGTVFFNIDGSPFCAPDRSGAHPSCGFYAEALATYLQLFDLRAAVRVSRCRASGSRSCLLMVLPDQARAAAAVEGAGREVEHETWSAPVEAPPEPRVDAPPPPLSRPGLALVVRSDRAALEARWNLLAVPSRLPARAPVGQAPHAAIPAGADADGDPEAPWHRL